MFVAIPYKNVTLYRMIHLRLYCNYTAQKHASLRIWPRELMHALKAMKDILRDNFLNLVDIS
jgi:hypothetical protein